ncbi:MAG: hypothetical protein U0N17_07145, partial [Agathobaculum butyriciproducens]
AHRIPFLYKKSGACPDFLCVCGQTRLNPRVCAVRCGGANGSDFYAKSCHAGTVCKQTEIESRHGAKKPLFTEQWLFCNSQFSITEPKW